MSKYTLLKDRRFFFLAILAAFLLGAAALFYCPKKGATPLKVFSSELPSSLDPLSYDLSKHHPLQSIFHIKLVTQYRGQGIFPQLAQSWKSEDSNRTWRFKIREDIQFSDKTAVTPEIVVFSLKRAIFKMKAANSKHQIVSEILDVKNLDKPSKNFAGLKAEGRDVVFRFKTPYKNLPEAVSFGIFAIANPKNFDSTTGEWNASSLFNVTGSGPYRLISLDSKEIQLQLKEDYPQDLHSKRAHNVVTFFNSREMLQEADLASLSYDDNQLEKTHSFHGRRAMHILYFFCHGWKNPESPVASKELRELLRGRFESLMSESGLGMSETFFPTVMPGVHPVISNSPKKLFQAKSGVIRVLDLRGGKSKVVNAVLELLESAIRSIGLKIVWIPRMSQEDIKRQLDPNLSAYDYDIGLYATGMSIEDVVADARLMFSKEGIWLPDLDGSIHRELGKAEPNLQIVNQLIYDQALVWSGHHYSVGSWVRKNLDLSEYNTLLPLGELQWIGVK